MVLKDEVRLSPQLCTLNWALCVISIWLIGAHLGHAMQNKSINLSLVSWISELVEARGKYIENKQDKVFRVDDVLIDWIQNILQGS